MRRSAHRVFVVFMAVSLFAAMSVAPVAASDDGISLGGDDGIGIGTDGVSIGGDDGVNVETDDGVGVGVGGDDGVNVGADEEGVNTSIGGDDGVGAEAGTDGVNVDVVGVGAGTDGVEVGDQNVSDGNVGDIVPNRSDDDAELTIVDESDDRPEATDIELDSDDVPEELRVLKLLLENAPSTNETGPEDFPLGDENAQVNVCDPLDLEASDLPIDALPELRDLPEELQPPGVPVDVLSNEALFSILLGLVPAPCDAITPNDPPVDPTDLPDEPGYTVDITRFGQFEDGGVALINFDGTLNESGDGPGIDGKIGALATSEFGDLDNELIINDGEKDIGIDQRTRYNEDGSEAEAVLILFGQNAGVAGECDSIEEIDEAIDLGNLEENPLGPCEVELVGLPNLVTPEDVVGIITGLGDDGLPILDDDIGLTSG